MSYLLLTVQLHNLEVKGEKELRNFTTHILILAVINMFCKVYALLRSIPL